jgi:hypothetical protein
MGALSLEEIGRGLLALGGSLAILAGGMYLMAGGIPGAIAMGIMAVSLGLFVPVLALLSSIPLSGIVVGLVAIAGVFTVLGLAAYFLAPLVPAIIGLAGSILMLGAAVLAVGGGVALFGTGLALIVSNLILLGTNIGIAAMAVYKALPTIGKIFEATLRGIVRLIAEVGPDFVKAMVIFLDSLIQAVEVSLPKIVKLFFKLLVDILDQIDRALPRLIELGASIIISLLKGIDKHIRGIVDAAVTVVIQFIDGISARLGDLIQAGINFILAFINGLAEGIRNNSDKATEAMINLVSAMIEALVKAAVTIGGKFNEVGKNLVDGLINGLKGMLGEAKAAAKNLGISILESAKRALGVQSPSKFFKEIGENLAVGLTKGIDQNADKPVKASENMAKKVTKNTGDAVKKANEAAKKAFEASVDWIDERKYYNQLSLEQELAAWERVQARYKAGSEERKKADREVYRVKQELIKKQTDDEKKAIEDRFNNSKNWIDNETFYDKAKLTERLAAWRRIQDYSTSDSDNYKEATRQIYSIQKELESTNKDYTQKILDVQTQATDEKKQLEDEYYAKTKEINTKLKNDINEVTKEYKDAVKQRADSLYNAYGLFDKVPENKKITGFELLKNLQQQVKSFDFWRKNIGILANRGLDPELIKELEALGPTALAEIQGLTQLSDKELRSYVTLWQQKHKAAKDVATNELEGLRTESIVKISKLQADAKVELDKYRNEWAIQMMKLQTDTMKSLDTLKAEWLSKVGDMRRKSEGEFLRLTKKVSEIMKDPNWSQLGADVIGGIVVGVNSSEMALSDAMANIAKKALEATKSTLGIKSPSKEFAKIGSFAILGLIEGIKATTNSALTATGTFGNQLTSTLQDALSTTLALLNGPMDLQPTIRPVIDMSNVEAGISNTFGQNRTLKVSGVVDKAAIVATNSRIASEPTSISNQTDNSNKSEIKITNNYTVRSNEDIRKISTDLKNTLDRYSYAKGVLVT